MVVYPADGAVSADPVPACVEAGEGESVAVLVLRTVVVLQAVHVAAPALVGVAGKQAGWARTLKSHKFHVLFTDGARAHLKFFKQIKTDLSHMVPGHANGSGTALEGAASFDTSSPSLMGSTNLALFTLHVVGAGVPSGGNASRSRIGTSH